MPVTSRKNAVGGQLGVGLMASNLDQLLFIILKNYEDLNALHITKIALLGISLFMQVNSTVQFN